MTILATAALIVLILVGIMVLRMKSDPMEKESVRKLLADRPSSPEAASPTGSEKNSKDANS
jgi:hypothetical protein